MARQKPLTRDEFGLFRRLEAPLADIDSRGQMNSAAPYSLFDAAINGWLTEEGFLDISDGETSGMVTESGCSIFSRIETADKVVAGIRIAHIGTNTVRYEVALFRDDDETAAAQGHVVHDYVDGRTLQPKQIDTQFRGRLEDFIK